MGSLTQNERALLYALRLKAASDAREEARKIKEELGTLVYSTNNKRLSRADKVAILTETKKYLRGGTLLGPQILVEANDNKGTIDIIDSIINDL